MAAIKGQPTYNIYGLGGRPVTWTEELIDEEVESLLDWMQEPNNIFLTDFAVHRGYSDRRIREWRKHNQKLELACQYLESKQKIALIKGGLAKKLSYPMCALLLSNWHDMHMRTDQRITADVTAATLIEEITGETKDLIDGQNTDDKTITVKPILED